MGCGASTVSPAVAVPDDRLDKRLEALEVLSRRQAGQIADLERVAPKQLLHMHYNVLADQYGSNLQPWFLYGAEPPVSAEEREQLVAKFYEKDEGGLYANLGWPRWAPDELLSPERREQIERYDREHFVWAKRSERLWQVVVREDPDVLTLVECDHYEDFWLPRLRAAGYESCWRKRPRASCRDGCCIAWRVSMLELVAEGGVDFGDSLASQQSGQLDRTCLFGLLRYTRDPKAHVLVATTHLARNPENPRQMWTRGFQYGRLSPWRRPAARWQGSALLLFRELLAFAEARTAVDAPVILSGDLNAQDCDELSGIERALVILASAPAHPLLWSVADAPTPPTTKTDARCMRIDYVLYQSAKLQLLQVAEMPRLELPIPDAQQPSDHLPVLARFEVRTRTAQMESAARQWLFAISGHAARPLSDTELRVAFNFFDKDGTGVVRAIELHAGMQILDVPSLGATSTVQSVVQALADLTALIDAQPDGLPREAGMTIAGPAEAWGMTFGQFALLYVSRTTGDSGLVARQLEMAFGFFDADGDGTLTHEELRQALDRIAPVPMRSERIEQLVRELDANGDGHLSLAEFSGWCMARYAKMASDPTQKTALYKTARDSTRSSCVSAKTQEPQGPR